jgi:Ribosomal protein L2
MAIRKYKPTTPGRRGASGSDFSEVTRSEPEKSLVRPLHSQGGRNVHGHITARHQGGGHKRSYRLIDFRRADKDGVPAKVAHIEYDPNRTARIALLHLRTARSGTSSARRACRGRPGGERSRGGHQAGQLAAAALHPDRHGGARHRAAPGWRREDRAVAGSGVQLLAKEGGYAQLRMPSGEIRRVDATCRATVGEVGNSEQGNIKLGKAGRNRWKGRRPTVRGVAMNPVDHPLGGGEGKSSGGRHPVSPWGKPRAAPGGRTSRVTG